MTKFIMTTLRNNSTVFDGPSGASYVINRSEPFNVENKLDVDFFSGKNQFKKVGIFTKKKPEKPVDELLIESLIKIKGISETVAKQVAKIYLSEDYLHQHIFEGNLLDNHIPKRASNIIINHYQDKKKTR